MVFSSIFYWCKYARHILNQKDLSASIHPKFYETIARPSNIDFIASNCKQELVRLFGMSEGVVSYVFVHNHSIYISSKSADDHEYLIKIPSDSMAAVKLLIAGEEQECTPLIVELAQSLEVYEYYHRSSVWNCSQCGAVNDAADSLSIDASKCIACGSPCDGNNPVHFLQMKLSSMTLDDSSKKHVFASQSRFYRKLSAFDTRSVISYVPICQ